MVLVDFETETVVVILSVKTERMFIADSDGNIAIDRRTIIDAVTIPLNEWLGLDDDE